MDLCMSLTTQALYLTTWNMSWISFYINLSSSYSLVPDASRWATCLQQNIWHIATEDSSPSPNLYTVLYPLRSEFSLMTPGVTCLWCQTPMMSSVPSTAQQFSFLYKMFRWEYSYKNQLWHYQRNYMYVAIRRLCVCSMNEDGEYDTHKTCRTSVSLRMGRRKVRSK